MISKLELNKLQEDLIQVVDKSEYDYSSFPSKFLRNDTISINFLQKITSKNSVVKQVYISKHDNLDETTFKIPEDGYYRISHLIIPTKDWLEKLDLENVTKFEKIYFYMDGEIYDYNFKTKQSISINPTILLGVCDLKSTVFFSEEDFISIQEIKNCLVNLISNKFSKQNCKETKDNLLNTRIEYLQMIYNMLDYYISCGNLVEALNILEQFNECYDVCKKSNNSKCNCI